MCCWLLVVVIGWLLVVFWCLFVVCCLLFVVYGSLFVVVVLWFRCLMFELSCLPIVVCGLLCCWLTVDG